MSVEVTVFTVILDAVTELANRVVVLTSGPFRVPAFITDVPSVTVHPVIVPKLEIVPLVIEPEVEREPDLR